MYDMKPKPTQGSDIERLFYLERSYNQIFESLTLWVAEHFSAMELDYARIKFPDTATLLSMELKYATDIAVIENTILFDAVVACEVELSQDGKICLHDQWFRVPCEITIEDRIKSVSVGTIQVYERANRKNKIGKVDADLVPMIYKKNLDDEATRFLERYYSQALQTPMAVPIANIVENIMGLKLLNGGKLSRDFSAFGQICFSSGSVDLFDIWDGKVTPTEVERGTIVIDSSTYWERNLGCVNNTIAHRCPAKSKRAYNSEENAEWSDIERMEWQADHVAPRILMPIQTVRPHIESLYEAYGFHQNPDERKLIVECVISDLAEMYKVSKLSAKIRMLDLGYTEANEVYNYEEPNAPFFNTVSPRDAFYEYCDNEDFRKIVDSGMFVYVGGHFVINHEKYVIVGDDGELSLTDYAYNNFTECTLQFTYRRVNMERHGRFHTDIFHRGNHATYEQLPHYDTDRNYPVYELAGGTDCLCGNKGDGMQTPTAPSGKARDATPTGISSLRAE
jgi:hypothetical protein